MRFISIPISTARFIAFIRVLLGSLLVYQAIMIMDPDFLAALPGQLNTMTINNPLTVIHFLVYMVLIPQSHHVGTVLVIATLSVGSALILGFLTRGAALLGFLYAGILFALSAHMGWAYQQNAILMAFGFLSMMLLNAGQYYGLDVYLFRQPQPVVAKPRKSTAKPKKIILPPKIQQLAAAQTNGKRKKVAVMPPDLHAEKADADEDDFRSKYDSYDYEDDDE